MRGQTEPARPSVSRLVELAYYFVGPAVAMPPAIMSCRQIDGAPKLNDKINGHGKNGPEYSRYLERLAEHARVVRGRRGPPGQLRLIAR